MPTSLPQQRAAAALQLGMTFGSSPKGVGFVAVQTLVRTSAIDCRWIMVILWTAAPPRRGMAVKRRRLAREAFQYHPALATQKLQRSRRWTCTTATMFHPHPVRLMHEHALATWMQDDVVVKMPDPVPLKDHMLPEGPIGAESHNGRKGNGFLVLIRLVTIKGSMGGADVSVARTRAAHSGAGTVILLVLGMVVVAPCLKRLVDLILGFWVRMVWGGSPPRASS